MKQDYWKAVTTEFPGGLICSDRSEALYFTQEDRDCGGTGYVRKIRMTEDEYKELQELDY